jgi:hypothetical protein
MINVDPYLSITETLYTSTTLSLMRIQAAIGHHSSEFHQVDSIKTEIEHADVIPDWKELFEDICSREDYLRPDEYGPEDEDSDEEAKEREHTSTEDQNDERAISMDVALVCLNVGRAAESLGSDSDVKCKSQEGQEVEEKCETKSYYGTGRREQNERTPQPRDGG